MKVNVGDKVWALVSEADIVKGSEYEVVEYDITDDSVYVLDGVGVDWCLLSDEYELITPTNETLTRPDNLCRLGDVWKPFPDEAIVKVWLHSRYMSDDWVEIRPAKMLNWSYGDFSYSIIKARRLDRPK